MSSPENRSDGPVSEWLGRKVYRVEVGEEKVSDSQQCTRIPGAPCVFNSDGRKDTEWSEGCSEHNCMHSMKEDSGVMLSVWLFEADALRMKLLGVP